MIYFKVIVISMMFLVSSSIAFAQGIGEENELSPEELDAAFSSSDYDAMKARYSDKVYSNQTVITADDLVAQADLVIEGIVSDIHYSYGKNDLPYAHTEIAVSRILKGKFDGPTLMITQEGGPSRDGNEGYLVSDTHFFDVSESELVFLDFSEDNTLKIVNRFRIYQEKMYNVDGYGLLMDAIGGLRFSQDRNPAQRFKMINMGTHQLWKKFSEPEGDTDISGQNNAYVQSTVVSDSYSESITVDDFIAILR